MEPTTKRDDILTKPVLVEEELKTSFLDYAMSVVVAVQFPIFVMA